MFSNPRKVLKIINWILYVVSIALLSSGLVLSTAVEPVEAAGGSVKTRSSCGAAAVDTNHYAVGDHVFIYYTGMGAGTHTWEIRYTNKAGKPLVEIASNPSIQGTGTVTGDTGCFDAWIIQPEEANYRFSATVDDKQDGYVVDLPTATPTLTATSTHTATATATNTFTPTATSTSTATNTPTDTHTPTPPATTLPATETPVSTETPSDPTTATPTDEPTVPTSTPLDPTGTEVATLDPTGQPTDAFTTTPQPTPQVTATEVPTFSMPSSANANVLSPMTGADFSRTTSGSRAAGRLQMSGLAVLGAAIVLTGYRRKYNF